MRRLRPIKPRPTSAKPIRAIVAGSGVPVTVCCAENVATFSLRKVVPVAGRVPAAFTWKAGVPPENVHEPVSSPAPAKFRKSEVIAIALRFVAVAVAPYAPPVPSIVSVNFPPELLGSALMLKVPDRRFAPGAELPAAPMYEKVPVNPCSVNELPLLQLTVQFPSEVLDAVRRKLASTGVLPNPVATRKVRLSCPDAVIDVLVPLLRIEYWTAAVVWVVWAKVPAMAVVAVSPNTSSVVKNAVCRTFIRNFPPYLNRYPRFALFLRDYRQYYLQQVRQSRPKPSKIRSLRAAKYEVPFEREVRHIRSQNMDLTVAENGPQ